MRLELPTGTPAELAIPPDAVRRGVVLVPDIMGLRPLFDDLCRQLADDYGWAVCAPDPFPGRETLTLEERRGVMAGLDDGRQLADLAAAVDVVVERTNTGRVAVLGFCMGGMYAFKAAGTGRYDRVVSFYGMIRVPEAWRAPGQGEPLDALARPEACPVLAILGGRDMYTPPEDIDSLRAVGERVTVVVYPEGEHGFVHDPSRPSHRSEDAADAWRRVAEFLA